ncbi:hypothetical protein HanRHA438_Chr11g0488781 [Helianthus annuus]|nr:hypothetical protein HanRHA438_Chr11g0488781 [Helianthus annuus]
MCLCSRSPLGLIQLNGSRSEFRRLGRLANSGGRMPAKLCPLRFLYLTQTTKLIIIYF